MNIKIKWEYFALGIVFLIAIGIRLYYVQNTAAYSYDAYFSIRQIENIVSRGVPIYHDGLSYSGRDFFVLPVFYYVMAFFRFFLSENMAFLVIPNIISGLLAVIAFFIAYEVTKSRISALFCSFLVALTPIYVAKTVISLSPLTLAIVLFFLCMYFFMKCEENVIYMWLFLITFVLLLFTHAIAYLMVLGLVVYLLFLKLENLKHAQEEIEFIAFSFLISLWVFFIIFKKPLLIYGPIIIWENLPKTLIEQVYARFDILSAVYQSGIVPFLLGLYAIFLYFFQRKNKRIYLLISLVIVIFLTTWLGFIEFEISIILLSILLAILSAQTYVVFTNYFKKTHFANFLWIFVIFLFAIGIILSGLALNSFVKKEFLQMPNEKEIEAVKWLENIPEDSVVVAPLNLGQMITTIGKRRNMIDTAFLLAPAVNERYEDLTTLYEKFTPETEAVNILNKYYAAYIIYTENEPEYAKDSNCFKLSFDNSIKIYRLTCKVEEYG